MKTDHEIIKSFQAGNRSAFDELVRRYLSLAFGFFAGITGDRMAADDLAQEAFLRIYKNLGKFRFEAEFSTYLYRINLNLASSYLRRNRWRNFLHLDQAPEPVAAGPESESDWNRRQLWNAVARLPGKQRQVVIMRISQELPFRDIDQILDIAEGTAKVNYQHAVRRLKQLLEKENGF
ncbi:MAG: sigma-70 family RNA polymerase sigma factor [Candidatus Neomarinimicrobiota bacterium]